MTTLEEALERIEATTDMGDFGAGMLNAAGIIRDALASSVSDRQIIINLLGAHEGREDPEGCTAHGEGQKCCLDDSHPLGAGLRKALDLPWPETFTTWGPNGTSTHQTEPFDLDSDARLVLPQPDDTWEHIWIEGEPLNVVLDAGKDYVLHFTGPIPEGSSIRGGRNVMWLGSTR